MVLLSQTEYPLVSGLQSIFQDDQGGVISEGIFSLAPPSKLYTPSTLNIVLLQRHTHLNVCAVK